MLLCYYRTVKKQQVQPKRCLTWLVSNRCLTLLVLVCLILTSPFSRLAYGEESRVREYDLKAVYLYNFLHFVHWPDKKKTGYFEPKVISVVGISPIENSLKKLQSKLQKAGKKDLSINYLGPYHKGMNLSGCHLLFVSDSEKENFAKIIADLKNSPVLTVSDVGGFLMAGGMITLVTRKNKISWEINRTPVRLARLRISAKLLDIASMVMDTPEQVMPE